MHTLGDTSDGSVCEEQVLNGKEKVKTEILN